jgi:hypothetical protein
MRVTYAHAIQTAKGKFHGNAEEREGKLHFKGTVATEAEKNEIWTAIKTIPTWQKDVVADIQVTGGPAAEPARRPLPLRRRRQDLYGQGWRHPRRDCQGASGQRWRLHEDLRAEQGSVDGSRQDQGWPGPASPVVVPRESHIANARHGWRSISHLEGETHARHSWMDGFGLIAGVLAKLVMPGRDPAAFW